MGEDESKDLQEEVQKSLKKFEGEVDKAVTQRETEISAPSPLCRTVARPPEPRPAALRPACCSRVRPPPSRSDHLIVHRRVCGARFFPARCSLHSLQVHYFSMRVCG